MTPSADQEDFNLQACPFCGGWDLSFRQDEAEDNPGHFYAWHVFCRDCHAHGRNNFPIGWCESKTAAAEAWNLRGFKRYADSYKVEDLIEAATLAERNRCAKVALGFVQYGGDAHNGVTANPYADATQIARAILRPVVHNPKEPLDGQEDPEHK